jgi:hypothetical protein
MKDWEVVADNLKKAGWSLGCVSAIDSNGVFQWGDRPTFCQPSLAQHEGRSSVSASNATGQATKKSNPKRIIPVSRPPNGSESRSKPFHNHSVRIDS